MLVIVVTLWTMAAILILTNPKNLINRWGSALAFFTGFAPFCTFMGTQVIPSIGEKGLKDTLWAINCFCLSFPYHLAPYAYLMFSVHFTGVLRQHKRVSSSLTYIFLIPVLYMYFTTPILPKYKPDPFSSTLWVGPYLLSGTVLLFYAYFKEKNKHFKRHTFFTLAVLAPCAVYSLFTNYFLRIFHINHLWKYSVVPGVITFIIFIYGLARFSVMGVKLKPEEHILEGTIKAFSSGMGILSHTLKNEIGKISICMTNIRESLNMPQPDTKDANENIQVVMDSVAYLSKLIARLRKQIEEITLFEEEIDLKKMVEAAVGRVIPYIRQENIQVAILFSSGIVLKCDQLHILETITNILKNSIEALDKGGTIEIWAEESKKHLHLSIYDSGEGIPGEDIHRIFEPFYSTKSRENNFGLGLSYCYSVMKKHKGNLEISSTEGLGTTVIMTFPKSRVLSLPESLKKRSTIYG